MKSRTQSKQAFSLVEVLAAITIIGIITFLAIPNIVQIKQDGEDNLARARAESLNMAMASLIQANGRVTAVSRWTSAGSDAGRFALLTPYLAFAETNFASYMPNGYSVAFPAAISPPTKVTLRNAQSNVLSY
ncbi:MAG: prepilin-type N-terminal cleavage/methylation domain-containing protein [Terrimicrobiaceae bacterium]